jgi:hypothetical protein
VTPTRFLPWHGRTVPASARVRRAGLSGLLDALNDRIGEAFRRPAPALAG